jgi:predicted DNA-binding antitoxin AbrB/MazE fold protein
MVASVRAVYREGRLQLLETVDLAEGQVVDITIYAGTSPASPTTAQADAQLRLAGVLMDVSALEEGAELAPDERMRIGALFTGERSSEDLIDEDRQAT